MAGILGMTLLTLIHCVRKITGTMRAITTTMGMMTGIICCENDSECLEWAREELNGIGDEGIKRGGVSAAI